MKPKLLFIALVALASRVIGISAFAASYQIPLPFNSQQPMYVLAGYRYKADTLNNSMDTGDIPTGTVIYLWTNGGWNLSSVYNASQYSWFPDLTLNPGDAFFIEVPPQPSGNGSIGAYLKVRGATFLGTYWPRQTLVAGQVNAVCCPHLNPFNNPSASAAVDVVGGVGYRQYWYYNTCLPSLPPTANGTDILYRWNVTYQEWRVDERYDCGWGARDFSTTIPPGDMPPGYVQPGNGYLPGAGGGEGIGAGISNWEGFLFIPNYSSPNRTWSRTAINGTTKANTIYSFGCP